LPDLDKLFVGRYRTEVGKEIGKNRGSITVSRKKKKKFQALLLRGEA